MFCRMASKLAIIMIIAIMSENLKCVNAIRCHQCMDQTLKMDSEEMQKIMEDSGTFDLLPSCTEDDATDCGDDMFDLCSARIVQFSGSVNGLGLQSSIMNRACAASISPQTTDEDTICNAVKDSLASDMSMEVSLDESFKCKLITCQTDLCNTQGVEVFEENGGVETDDDGGKGDYVNVSSGNRVVGCIGIILPFALFSGLSSF